MKNKYDSIYISKYYFLSNNNMNQVITKRLSRDTTYNKSKKSYQDTLSPDEIKKKLDEYTRVEDINTVNLNTHLRYFSINTKTGEKQFRLGGFLTKIDNDYVILSNGTLSWSVQKKNTIFFQKMSFSDLKEELVKKVSKKFEQELSDLSSENKILKETLKQVKKEVKKNSNRKTSARKSSKK